MVIIPARDIELWKDSLLFSLLHLVVFASRQQAVVDVAHPEALSVLRYGFGLDEFSPTAVYLPRVVVMNKRR